MQLNLFKRGVAALVCSAMLFSGISTPLSVLAAENESGSIVNPVNGETESLTSENVSSHFVYGWNEEPLTLHYETGYAPAWEALSSVLPTSVSANTDEGSVDVSIKGWTYNESYDVNKTGTYLIESVIDEKYALGEGVSNFPAYVVIEDVHHLVHFEGLEDITALPGSNVDVLDGIIATDGEINYTVGISSITAKDAAGNDVDPEMIEFGEDYPVIFDALEGYTYAVSLVALDSEGLVVDCEPAIRYVYVKNLVQPRAPSLKKAPLLGTTNSGVTSIDEFLVEFVTGAELGTASDSTSAYIWDATRSTSGHQYVYRISYATSGIDTTQAEALQIRVPLHLIKDRDGQYADTIEVGVPEESEVEEGDIGSEEVEYVYRIEGDEVVIYNRLPVSAAVNGYVEVAYAMDKTTFNYIDMSHTDEMHASMSVNGHTASDTDFGVGINTGAKIVSTDKRFPTLYKEWQSSWGTAPADAGDYFYLHWEIRSVVEDNITQPYTLTLVDMMSSNPAGTVEPVSYKLAGSGAYTTTPTIDDATASGYRYDYVVTRHDKATFQTLDKYTIYNNIVVTLTPKDGIDTPTVARSSRSFPYEKPTFKYPTGHFMAYKRGDGAYRTYYKNNQYIYAPTYLTDMGFRNNEYSRYDLGSFTGKDDEPIIYEDSYGDVDGVFDFAAWMVGYPYPWTIEDEADWTDPNNFGQIPVRYELIDDGVYLYADGGEVSNQKLSSQDFQIDQVTYRVTIKDEDFDEETQKFVAKDGTFTDDDILIISTKSTDSANTFQEVARVNLKTGEVTQTIPERIVSAETATATANKTTGVIQFADNVIGYKLETSNAYYFTEIDSVPNISLKKSDYVMSVIGNLDSMALRNTVTGNVYKTKNTVNDTSDDSRIFNWTEQDTDFARITQRDSYLKKDVVSTSNNKIKRTFTIGWKIAQEETITFGLNEHAYVPQESGIFYDLLPAGMHADTRSVAVQTQDGYLADNSYETEVIANYKGSGRDLLKVIVNEEAEYYNLYFNTTIDWDGIRDFGTGIYNPVAYETGNEQIKYGFPDNGGDISKEEDREYLSGLDEAYAGMDETEIPEKFIYADEYYDIVAITAATANVRKFIRNSTEATWSRSTETEPNGEYFYRLRFMSAVHTTTEDIILFDSLESYKVDGTDESDWHGILKEVDVSQIEMKGVAPVIYLSSVSDLDLDAHHDLTDASIWKKASEFGDIENAKAIAIDCRKKPDGSDFILESMESLTAILRMQAPAGASSSKVRIPIAYNNVYIWDITTRFGLIKQSDFDHWDYVQIIFVVKADVKLHKYSSEDGAPIKNIKFKLRGTSDYGDEIEKIVATNRQGMLTFTDIPKGTYTIAEYQGIDDFLEDHTEHTVQITDEGHVLYDGTDITGSQIEFPNDPRIHADVPIGKRDNASTDLPVQNTTFKLSGTSDYGNEVVMIETTDSVTGNLTFRNLEMGTYTLEEIQANDEYILDPRKYIVVVDENGNVSIDGLSVEAEEEEEPFTVTAKYAVSVYGIETDVDDKGNTMGITFGPALGADYTISYHNHIPSGNTLSGNPHRCVHDDDWETIIYWNQKDPDVYEDCIVEGCTHKVELDLTKAEDGSGNKLFNTTSNFLDTNPSDGAALQAQKRNGDGPSMLYYELMPANSNYENLRWNPVSNGTNTGGWGASRIRAMLNGADDKTTLTDSSQSSDVHKSASVYTEDNCLFACFPKELQQVIGYRAVKYDSVYNAKTNTNLKIAADRLWLLSPNEIWTAEAVNKASSYYTHPLEGSQYPYFETRANSTNAGTSTLATRNYRVKNFSGSGNASTFYWWLRSSNGSYSSGVLYVDNGGYLSDINASNSYGVAPCFTLSRSSAINDPIKDPSKKGERFIIYNEKYHRVTFSKRSSLDDSGLQGAMFRLYGKSNYDRDVDLTATSNENGTVQFEKIESGVYTLVETSAPEGYALDSTPHAVVVYRNGDVEIKGLSFDSSSGLYKWTNVKKRDKEIVVVKKWVDGLSNEERPMPAITLTTEVPRGRVRYYTVRYHASNADQTGTFGSGDDVNEVRYESVTTGTVVPKPLVKISHSNNIKDDGTRTGNYAAQTTVDSVTIDGAATLKVEVWYGLYNSGSYNYLSIYDGTMTPSKSNALNANVSGGKLCNYASGYQVTKPEDDSIYHKSYTVIGDTVQFLFYSLRSFNYYGYWAEIVGYQENGNVVQDGNDNMMVYNTTYTEVGTSTYERPNIAAAGYGLVGWYQDDVNQTLKFKMTGISSDLLGRLPVSNISDLDIDNNGTIDVYAKYAPITLIEGETLNAKLKTLAKGVEVSRYTADTMIKEIQWSAIEPTLENRLEKNLISTVDSAYPIYAWFDNTDSKGVIYMWSASSIVLANANSGFAFSKMKNLVNLNALVNVSTENVTKLNSLFSECTNLEDISAIANWNTGNIKDMGFMFSKCSSLKSVDSLSDWDTGNVRDMGSMYSDCSSLENISGLSRWDTSQVTSIYQLFKNCSLLADISPLTEWNTNNVTDMSYAFYSCGKITNINALMDWDTEKTKNMSYMLYGCGSLTDISGVANWNVWNVTNMAYMFYYCDKLKNLDDLEKWNTGNVTNMSYMFQYCTSLTNINGLAGWDTGNVTDMKYMFRDCRGLTNVNDFAGWNTGKVTDMRSMFYGCSNLTNLNGLANWNTGNVTNMGSMFCDCSGLTNLEAIASWNTGNVTNMIYMFQNCRGLTNLEAIASWNIEKVTDMSYIFYNCFGLTNLNSLSNWNTGNVTNMSGMFYNCSGITNVDGLANWNTEKVTNMGNMFYNCSGLTNASGINSWADNISNCTNFNSMFYNANSQHPDWSSVYPNGTWDSVGTFQKN